ncbi:MAG: hypothetical protein AMJ78_02545 [Omnitrophica WOR_2 bacterium SM23_29]|nr:MAG: hypothetical protein AMJ78_02545 [Omnitrophica WOR_2 bacterium SM23_29]
MKKILTRKINFISLILSVATFFVFSSINVDAQEIVYHPYPIIFIHGINSKMGTWGYSKNNLEIYFKSGNVYKYKQEDQKNYGRQNYFPNCDYEYMNNGDIKAITFELKKSIDNAISSLSTKIPDNEKKVIIVAHSMGGLVTRALLKYDEKGFAGKEKDYYKSKIDKIIFIGTSHLGAPIASVLWIYNEISEEDLPALLDDNVNFYSQTTLTPFRFQQTSPSTSNFDDRKMAILAEERKIAKILAGPRILGPYPDGIALEQLRLVGDVSCSYYIESYGIEPIPIIKSITGSNTFLGKTPSDLAIPPRSVFKVIRGKNTEGINIPSWAINKIIGKYENDFIFPVFNQETQSLTDCATGEGRGDGIVTKASQEGIGSADYIINAFHTSETNAWQTILQAIDDKPMIEDVRVVRLLRFDYSYYLNRAFKFHFPDKTYIIIKTRDYLLADIEFETNIRAINLEEYRDDTNKPYKPYFKFGRDFLKERTELIKDANGTEIPLRLQPGEFYLEVKGPLYKSEWIRLKNPAGKETECEIYTASGTAYVARGGVSLSFWNDDLEGWVPMSNYSDDRWKAYNSFLSMPESLSSSDPGGPLGAYVHGSGGYFNVPYYPGRFAYIAMEYLGFVAFNLNITDKKIKSVKFAGYVNKELEGGGKDFKIFVLRDTSNIWPVTLNSQGDKLLFELNTLSYQDSDSFETAIEPFDLNLNGYNVWQCRSNIPIPVSSEDNIIPASIPNEGSIRNVEVRYHRSFYISNPVLIIIYE